MVVACAAAPSSTVLTHIASDTQASELSRFIDEELLKEGKEGELAKLLAKQNSQRVSAFIPDVHSGCAHLATAHSMLQTHGGGFGCSCMVS